MQWTRDLRYDIPAGVVVFFVAVPLCLGIALASGAPLFSGLIAGMVGGVVVGILSGSPLGVAGPAAGLAVIVFDSIHRLGSFEIFLVAVVLAGVLQAALGFAQAGVLGYFFPSSVIRGMLSGIGILIILKQIPHSVGWDSNPEGDLSFLQPDGETTISSIGQALGHIEPSAMIVSVSALFILIGWERWLGPRARIFQLVQGPLVAVAFGIAFQLLALRFAPGWALDPSHLVNIPVAGEGGISALLISPDWSQLTNPAVYLVAVTIAVVASLETLLCLEATDKLDPQKRVTPANRELLAQGAGNMISGFLGGLPLTQVIVRSSANIQSGGRTKQSTILHGALLVVFSFALPSLLNLIPLSVLASILFVVGYKLAKPAVFAGVYREGPGQFAPFIVTIVAMVLTDLLIGVGIGMAVAIGIILYRSYRNSVFLHIEESDTPGQRHRVRMQLAEQVTFLNRGAILRELSDIPDRSQVVLDMSNSVSVDHDVLEIIRDFEESARGRDIVVEIRGAPETKTDRAA